MGPLAAWFLPKVSDRKNAQFAVNEAFHRIVGTLAGGTLEGWGRKRREIPLYASRPPRRSEAERKGVGLLRSE